MPQHDQFITISFLNDVTDVWFLFDQRCLILDVSMFCFWKSHITDVLTDQLILIMK